MVRSDKAVAYRSVSRRGREPPPAIHDKRIGASCRHYDRRTELARVLPLWPHELDDESPPGRLRIVGKLRRALRAERRRGIAGHWTYDLGRHVELLRLYRLELASCGVQDARYRHTFRDTTSRS